MLLCRVIVSMEVMIVKVICSSLVTMTTLKHPGQYAQHSHFMFSVILSLLFFQFHFFPSFILILFVTPLLQAGTLGRYLSLSIPLSAFVFFSHFLFFLDVWAAHTHNIKSQADGGKINREGGVEKIQERGGRREGRGKGVGVYAWMCKRRT